MTLNTYLDWVSTSWQTATSHDGKLPPELPDLSPIENMWHELKEFLCQEIKPRTKDELVSGIQKFWGSVSGKKCRKYIHKAS